MATGLIALLDDVAAIAKAAAASLDDVAAQAAKSGAKAAGIVIDDTAVAPSFVLGISPQRELPIVARIARGSLINKLVFLLPIALALGYLAPWAITPLLMVGGVYLSYEGAEKVLELFAPHAAHEHEDEIDGDMPMTPKTFEDHKVRGAVRTDFILSAEIMAITLASVETSSLITQVIVLAAVAVGITAGVYGVVGIIVKTDDVGLAMSRNKFDSPSLRAIVASLGRGMVVGMPKLLTALAGIGTAAMLWVGGSILIHGLAKHGVVAPEEFIEHWAGMAADLAHETAAPSIEWLVTTFAQGVVGIVVGAIAIPVVGKIIAPIVDQFRKKEEA